MRRSHLLILACALGAAVACCNVLAATASGHIAATPNPCVIPAGQYVCTSHITWSTQGVTHARVYVTAETKRGKEEKEFSTSRACETERCRAPWIEKDTQYVFTLYDYSSGNRGRALSEVVVQATGGSRK